MTSLAGKTVLITGASGDVGRACAEVFLAAGARLMLLDRVAPAAQLLARTDVAFAQTDVTDRTQVRAGFELHRIPSLPDRQKRRWGELA